MDMFFVNVFLDEEDEKMLSSLNTCYNDCNCDCHGGGCYCITD